MQARKNAWRLLAVKMTFVQCTSVKYRAKVGLLVFWCLPSSSFTTQTYLVVSSRLEFQAEHPN